MQDTQRAVSNKGNKMEHLHKRLKRDLALVRKWEQEEPFVTMIRQVEQGKAQLISFQNVREGLDQRRQDAVEGRQMAVQVSLSLRFRGILLYTGSVLFHLEWCIRQL